MCSKETDEFIKKCYSIHGDKYDYSKVEYAGAKKKVCIICPKHGEFFQTPTNHLSGKGCRKCGSEAASIKNTRNVQEFIEKAKKIHGDKYDYSKIEYKNCKEKACIICPKHGEFWQTPDKHLCGDGCPKCANEKVGSISRKSIGEFIIQSIEVHGNKYDYSKVDYKNYQTKVCIICPIHGEFWQEPSKHLNGKGCPICNEKKSQKKSKKKAPIDKTKEFIDKSKKIHGDKYDYSKVEYINSTTKVCIICPIHGEFWQMPMSHLKGHKCPKCSGKKICTVDVIKNFISKHGDKYDYSKVEYHKANEKVCIICPKHGEFFQTPNKHLNGHGCPKCRQSHLEEKIRLFLEENCIKYVSQKTFIWLKMKGNQYLDFYLPEHNIAIECQGKQHFYVDDYYFGAKNAEEEFKITLERDVSKLKKCNENSIKLIYFVPRQIAKYIINNKKYNYIYTDKNTLCSKENLKHLLLLK